MTVLVRATFFFSSFRRPPSPTLFPYTTLFRSAGVTELIVKAGLSYLLGSIVGSLLIGRLKGGVDIRALDRKSTRLNSSHRCISYAVFCLKKKIADAAACPLSAMFGMPIDIQLR